MTPFLTDLSPNTLRTVDKIIEVADGNTIPCTQMGEVVIKIMDDHGKRLLNVLHVPELTQRLLSTSSVTTAGHSIEFNGNFVTIHLGGKCGNTPVTIPINDANDFQAFPVHDIDKQEIMVSNTNHTEQNTPAENSDEHRKNKMDFDILRTRLAHRSVRAILYANQYGLWKDTSVSLSPDPLCSSIDFAVLKQRARSKNIQSRASHQYERLDIDIINSPSSQSLTPRTTFKYYLLIVDNYSRLPTLKGIPTETSPTTSEVIQCLMLYIGGHMAEVKEIRSDAGSQFLSEEFNTWCSVLSIRPTKAAPRHQEQNGVAERTWQSMRNLAYTMMLHARVDLPYCHHSLQHACYIYSILPVKGLYDDQQNPTTPYYLFIDTILTLLDFVLSFAQLCINQSKMDFSNV